MLVATLIGLPVVVLVAGTVGATAVFGSSCDLNALTPVAVGENSFVFAADGSELGVIPAERNRTPVSRAQISPWVPKATVAIEDRRFYQHGGVDPVGIARAFVADVRAGKFAQGGSTITQELVRNLYLSRDRTLKRKLTEACLAIKLAQQWPKDKILTAYMNQVFYGNHAYGVEAAAETYFSRTAKELNLEQAALIAGLPQAPSSYDPFRNPEAALARRSAVLHAMLVNGCDHVVAVRARRREHESRAQAGEAIRPHSRAVLFSYVEELLQQEYGSNTVREGGLKVYTTINPALQTRATARPRRSRTCSPSRPIRRRRSSPSIRAPAPSGRWRRSRPAGTAISSTSSRVRGVSPARRSRRSR